MKVCLLDTKKDEMKDKTLAEYLDPKSDRNMD